ncbi:MAG: hypothetical protein H6895_07325 [Defluviimonas sp.]|uniref:hypothetical protein n=1 Tax=Albidovulum sp. TaxID=1872424 RepID=UPI001D811494|nr:hypothetical protein [Paracoccaceae bacterium]MCC0063881.1 hypothetical protein [Defluviimonas sp.]
MSDTPVLSLIVTIVDGGDQLRGFLRRVEAFENAPSMEVIVPYDASIGETAKMATEFPGVRFLDIGRIDTAKPLDTSAGQHELFDRRRAAGLMAATGEIIGMLEDRGWPQADWAAVLVRLHRTLPNGVIGGAIECREPAGSVNWAFYVSDFGRYGRPFESGPVGWVSDVNVSYSRAALEETRHIWSVRFHEPLVHSFFLDRGERLYLSSELVVFHGRAPMGLLALMPERFGWGRLFGRIRTLQFSWKDRLKYILLGPVIPPLLWVRHLRTQFAKGNGARMLGSLPALMVLTTAWTAGEVWGYITGRA